MSKTYLKIKIMSLAAEAKIIRREERRWYGSSGTRSGLRNHRVFEVRSEARAAQVAYAFVRGRTYAQLERSPLTTPRWDRVLTLVRRYGTTPKLESKELLEWSAQETQVQPEFLGTS